jgi:hypothetical protein
VARPGNGFFRKNRTHLPIERLRDQTRMMLRETVPVNSFRKRCRLPTFSGSGFPFLSAVRSIQSYEVLSDATVSRRDLRDTPDLTGKQDPSWGQYVFRVSDRTARRQSRICSWEWISILPLVGNSDPHPSSGIEQARLEGVIRLSYVQFAFVRTQAPAYFSAESLGRHSWSKASARCLNIRD